MDRGVDLQAQQLRKDLIQRAAMKSIISGKNINVWQLVDKYPKEDRRHLHDAVAKERTRLLELAKGDMFLWPERYARRKKRLTCGTHAAAPVRPRQPNHSRTDTRRAVTRTLHLVDDSDDEGDELFPSPDTKEQEVASGGSSAVTFQWTRGASSNEDVLRLTTTTSPSLRRDVHATAVAMPRLVDSVKAAVAGMEKSSETQTQFIRELHHRVNETKDIVATELSAMRREIAMLREETRANQTNHPPLEPPRSMWSSLRWW